MRENDIKKQVHTYYLWEGQYTDLSAVWVRPCTIVTQDAAVFCVHFLRYLLPQKDDLEKR